MFTRSGELVNSQLIDLNQSSDPYIHDWTPDNNVVYALRRGGDATFITVRGPLSLAPAESYLVSEDGTANVRTLSVSPDGDSIAFDLFYPDNNPAARTFILSRSTGEIRLLAETAADRLVSTPEWSPDGSTILVTNADRDFFNSFLGLPSSLSHKMFTSANAERPVFINSEDGIGRIFDPQELIIGGEAIDTFVTEFEQRTEYWFFDDRVFWVDQ